MVTRIPANYRQRTQWIAGLDASSALTVGVGVVFAMKTLTGTAPVPEKAAEVVFALAMGGVFGLVRLPLDQEGDRMSVWMRRGLAYLRRDRTGSYFDSGAAGR